MSCELYIWLIFSHPKDQRLFQVSSRDDITIDHLVEENREHGAKNLGLRGSTAGR